MRTILRTVSIAVCFSLLSATTSCIVVTKKDNGKHKGWFKNSNNPHHPHTTNPGHTKKSSPGNSGKSPAKNNGNGKAKGKGK